MKKKLYLLSITCVMFLTLFSAICSVKAEDAYDYKSEVDKKYVEFLSKFDKNADGILTGEEVKATSSYYSQESEYVIKLSKHFKLEKVTELEFVSCSIDLADINMDSLPNLKKLRFEKCDFVNRKISNLTGVEDLTVLRCKFNGKANATITGLDSVKKISCYGVAGSKVNIINCSKLESLDIDSRNIINIENCPGISYVDCYAYKGEKAGKNLNYLSKLKKLNKLELHCFVDNKKAVDISKLKNIKELEVRNVNVKGISKLSNLTKLYMMNTYKKMDFGANKRLRRLSLSTSYYFDVSKNKNLRELNINFAEKYSDLRKNKKLKKLEINSDKFPKYINSLKVETLRLNSHSVRSVKVEGMKNLKYLSLGLTDGNFKVIKCNKLEKLNLYYNSDKYYKDNITNIIVKNNNKLQEVGCWYGDDCYLGKANVFIHHNKNLGKISIDRTLVDKMNLEKNSSNLELTYYNIFNNDKGKEYATIIHKQLDL